MSAFDTLHTMMATVFGEQETREMEQKEVARFEKQNQDILRKAPHAVRSSTLRGDYLVREYRGVYNQKFEETVLPLYLARPVFPAECNEAASMALDTLEDVRAQKKAKGYLGETPGAARARRKNGQALPNPH